MLSLQQNQRTRGQKRFWLEGEVLGGMGEGGTMCTHVSKCKNNKIKGVKKVILSKKSNIKGITIPNFKLYYRATVTRTV
jgi:hypothetical protein